MQTVARTELVVRKDLFSEFPLDLFDWLYGIITISMNLLWVEI